MADTAEALASDHAATADIIAVATQNPIVVLTDAQQFDRLFERMREETASLDADVSTKRGRDQIAAMAYKVSQTKTAIDKAGLALTEGWRKQTAQVNAARKDIVNRLDGLRDEVRAPLNAWEEREAARVASCQRTIAMLSSAGVVSLDETSADVRARMTSLADIEIDNALFQELAEQAVALKDAAILTLEIAVRRLERQEEEAAELQRLRNQNAEREAREERDRIEAAARAEESRRAAEQEAIAAAERARQEVERQQAVEAAAQAERERVEKEALEREQQAERDRQAERERIEAERAAERAEAERQLAESHARIAEAERQAQAERDARDLAERNRITEQERIAVEQAERERDQAHRATISGEAQAAIVALGVRETMARNIVLAIAGGGIPHVRIAF